MQVTKEVVHDFLTVPPQERQPVIDRVFVHAQQPAGRADAQPFGQRHRTLQIGPTFGPPPRIRCTRAGRYQRATHLALKASSIPMPAPKLQLRPWGDPAVQHAPGIATIACGVIHRSRPSANLSCGGYLPRLSLLLPCKMSVPVIGTPPNGGAAN